MQPRSNLSARAALLIALTAAGCATAGTAADRVAAAAVDFITPTGTVVGSALLWQDPLGVVHVDGQVQGLQPGQHGVHFHAVGRCDTGGFPTFASAGAHYNPGNRRHGLNAPDGPHAGDAPNVVVASDGRATMHFTTNRVTLTQGPATLNDSDGTALIIHEQPDDQMTDPSGNSGARVACGVVRIR